ncbi:MAG: FtsQ-type POTRA domain-containing protein [Kofleriaceae bacterium]
MDRSRRKGSPERTPEPPAASRLTVRAKPNRKRVPTTPLWARLPKPGMILNGCGRALRRGLPAIIGLVVVGAVGGTAWAGYRFVTTSPRFAITAIEVHGNHHVDPDQVRAALPIAVGDNVFAANVDSLTRGLTANPWIADASAHRILPHTLVIDIREHEAAAVAELGGLYLVDPTGHPFKRVADDGVGPGLPIVTGLDRTAYLADPDATARTIASALGALTMWKTAADRPSVGEVHVDLHGALTLHTYDTATAIQLGSIDAGLAARMHTFDVAWAQLDDAERARARAIHLDPRLDHVTVAFSPPQKDQ